MGRITSHFSLLTPRPCVSAGLRFAVILLSKTIDVGRDHLIHRKRSPFPYEGKALTRSKVGETPNVGRDTPYRGERSVAAVPAGRSPSPGGVGWRGLPLRTNHGADSGSRRTASIPPRRAERRAQVCGEATVGSDGQGNNKVRRLGWHLIHR